jgi:hypothetical protein
VGHFIERHGERNRLVLPLSAVSQDDLAGRLAAQGIVMDRSAVSRIENQSRYAMDYEAAAIARALKVSVAWLFGETR